MRVFQAFTALLLFYISNWNPNFDQVIHKTENVFFATYIYPNKFYYGLIIYIIILILEYKIYRRNKKELKFVLNGIIDQILKTRFDGNYATSRITVFKKRNGMACVLSMLRMLLIYNRLFDPKRIKQKIKLPNLFRSYLWIYQRVGHPNECDSYTHFLVPRNSDEIEGLCSKAAYTHKKEYAKLPTIQRSEFQKFRKFEQIEPQELRDRIKNYMKLSCLHDYNDLLSINRPSKEILVQPLYKKKDLWGVIVFDQEESANSFMEIEQDLLYDIKMIDIVIG